MPATRRSSGGARSSGKQATLSFNHRVTKSVPKSAKNSLSSSSSSAAAPAKSPLAKHVANIEPDDVKEEEEQAETDVEEKLVVAVPEREKTEAELRADKVTSRQISQYWRDVERERRTKRLHQEGLSVAEKILRYWDVSSQYGPCVGISRLSRWQRADRLGLEPPVEVLAVLRQEDEKGTKGMAMAHLDDILNSTAVGSG